MLLSDDAEALERARFLATQARDSAPWYQHTVLGWNYRLSNVLAAIGRGQMLHLDERVAARRRIFGRYAETLGSIEGVRFMPEPSLTCGPFRLTNEMPVHPLGGRRWKHLLRRAGETVSL